MSSFFTLLLILVVYTDSVYSNSESVHYHIRPSVNVTVHCPGDPCLTLTQFAAECTGYCNETNISLSFLPGNHSLDRELILSNADNFSMMKLIESNGTVFVECGSQSGRFNIRETTFATIKDLHFIGCGGNRVSQVEQFLIEDTTFQGVEGRGTALALNEVTDASIKRSTFLSNTHTEHQEIFNIQNILNDVYLNRDPSLVLGGALYAAFSNVSIVSSKFTDNTAEIGGALFAHNSSLCIVGSTYSYNRASFGGVMATSESSVNIDNSTFSENAAGIHGGVMITYKDTFNISDAIFTNNNAAVDSGVMETYESLFEVIDSSFGNNTAERLCGVTYASNGSFSISNSSFTNNRAARGGVMCTGQDSSFNITSSTFTNNNAAAGFGGVMYIDNSSFDIDGNNFSHNGAAYGGVLYASGSLFDITMSKFSDNSAAEYGGVMYASGSLIFIASSDVYDNNAAVSGGIIYASGSSFNIASSNFSDNSAVEYAGVMFASESSFNITKSAFANNSAAGSGGVIYASFSSFDIISSNVSDNSAAEYGGVMYTAGSLFDIIGCKFSDNSADEYGGVTFASDSSFNITSSAFTNNNATDVGGVMYASGCSFDIISCNFSNNSAAEYGGVMYTAGSLFVIVGCNFSDNSAVEYGGVMFAFVSSLNITSSAFASNNVTDVGGVMYTHDSSFSITDNTFTNNHAFHGGIMYSSLSLFNITSSSFLKNSATLGGVIFTFNYGLFNITSSTFTNNSAARGASGVIFASDSSLNIINSSFCANKADNYGGIMSIVECSTHIADGMFDSNCGSLYIFSSNLTFSGYTRFENGEEPLNKMSTEDTLTEPRSEGGAITSLLSTVIFSGVSSLSNNQARQGGAVLATESKIIMYGEITIANNTASNSSGGGFFLQQSDLEIKGNCDISNNYAVRGGGIHTVSSTIAVYEPGTLQFINNRAENGSGVYLEVNAKLYVLKHPFYTESDDRHLLTFSGNRASFGGAIYVADDTNSGACSSENECFIQSLTVHLLTSSSQTNDLLFSGNTADDQGVNLFGGLLDRCIPSPFSEVYVMQQTHYSGISYLGNISNVTDLDTISSLPVRVCFCNNVSEPDCSYQPPTINVKKGETFNMPLVAVDQVNNSVHANIISALSSQEGGFSEGQQTQSVGRYCSNVTFNVFSPHGSETVNLYADGPCGSSTLSIRHLDIEFINCTCPVGFEPFNTKTRCECICDTQLSLFITNCDSITESFVKMNTNSWITYINDTDPPGYVIYPNCPFDYCLPPTENVSMNLNIRNGADAQCAHNRSGILCGVCQEHLSLSLGSSHCLPCHSYWPAVLVVILLAAIIAGILLVTALSALNMTVGVGLINGFIFYANIVAANSAVFFPSSQPSFPTVLVAWLNLDIGIDVCFFDGLDAYTKTWLQLAFPIYIISLVITVIIVSEYSPRFARIIGKRDPIATLATLILLSYAKLLSVTITALSFATLDYPDGSRETVWLLDGNMKYLQGKHIALVLMALLIILVGVPYTILLFLWQWLVRTPKWKVFKWTRNTKLNAFISVHHVPYNSKYRYWTGLLLLVRVVLYITASVTASDKPQTSLLITIVLVGGLFFIKEITGARVYKNLFVNIVETGLYFNLLALSAFSWHDFKADITQQRAVAYISTIITFILLVGVIIYHVYLLVRKDKPQERVADHEYPLAQVQATITHTSLVISNRLDQSQSPQAITGQ